jgi:hypothetical protein
MDYLVAFLATVRASGGGDGPEDLVGAYHLALRQIEWRDGAKTIIHIADAPAHGELYCGFANHDEEYDELVMLIEGVAGAAAGILVTGLDLNSCATRSFNECKTIYDTAHGRKYTVESFAVQLGWGDARVVRARARAPRYGVLMFCFCCSTSAPPPRLMKMAKAAAAARAEVKQWSDQKAGPSDSQGKDRTLHLIG